MHSESHSNHARTSYLPSYLQGAVLVEVLIALLLVTLTVAVNARAATDSVAQLVNLRHQHAAIELSSSMYERLTLVPTDEIRDLPEPAAQRCGLTDNCGPRIWLAGELQLWQEQAAARLPHGSATARRSDANIELIISWRGRAGKAEQYVQRYAIS